MTKFSEAFKNPNFDGNTILVECEDNEFVYISVLETFEFKTDDKLIDYIFLMGNNMIPYTRRKLYIFPIQSLQTYSKR